MSYEIGLYQSAFLKRALEEDLGDWTHADPIPDETFSLIHNWLLGRGYIVESEGKIYCEFVHPNAKWGLQVNIFKSGIAFAVPYWDESQWAIEVARSDSKELAKLAGLGYYDRQNGEVDFY